MISAISQTPPELAAVRSRLAKLPARQQPEWGEHPELAGVRSALAVRPALVDAADVATLRRLLAEAASGKLQILQAGDCAEDPAEATPQQLSRKVGLIDALAGIMRVSTGLPMLRVGRIAGQYAKPRSRSTEQLGDVEMPAYRGSMINRPERAREARHHDPRLMLACHTAAAATMSYLHHAEPGRPGPLIWTSHEALVLDYEIPQLRDPYHAGLVLTSTHWPWIGVRTSQPSGPHVALLALVSNPVACKVGPAMTPGELLELCACLDPRREPGRLTLIARMGAEAVTRLLPALVSAVRQAGHPVIWLCDPMHANTTASPCGRKTRFVGRLIREIRGFQQEVGAAGGIVGGLHLEVTPDPVTECAASVADLATIGDRYTTLCDPRLNPEQAVTVTSAWRT